MARVNTEPSNERTTPPFIAEPMHADTMVIGGARLDAAAFPANAQGKRYVPAGTPVGRTYAERDAGAGFGPVAFTAATSVDDEEVYLTAFDISDADRNADVELLRHGVLLYEDRLPDRDTLDAAVLGYIREEYQCIVSVDAQG